MKELEDHDRFPAVLRDFQTGFIGFLVSRYHVYRAFVTYLRTLSLPRQPLADLCSGSGEPAISIFKESDRFTHLSLSDKYPYRFRSREDRIAYTPHSVDVLTMPFDPGTCYSMFNAFHHFNDEDKCRIARRIQASGSMAFFVEILEPTATCLLKVLFTTTVGTLLLTPLMRPFSFKRMVLTYVLPINILTISFDGVVSVLRSRSLRQYERLFADKAPGIKVLHLRNGLVPLTVVHVLPKSWSAW